MNASVIVVGSGISGLLAAVISARKNRKTILLEAAPQVGGALRTFDYGSFGRFDYGMHNVLVPETAGLKELLEEFVIDPRWNPLRGNKRDLAGIFWQGNIQYGTPYPMVSSLPENVYREGMAPFINQLLSNENGCLSATELSQNRFGKIYSEAIVEPILEKIFYCKATELHRTAADIVPLKRLGLFNETLALDLLNTEIFRARIAFPEQRRLPEEKSSGRSAYYPRQMGISLIVDQLLESFVANGGEVIVSSFVKGLGFNDDSSVDVSIESSGSLCTLRATEGIIWTAGPWGLCKALGISTPTKRDAPPSTVLVNMVLKKIPSALKDLYYLYCYDAGFRSFRITCYSNFCPEFQRSGGYPLSVEMLYPLNPQIDSQGVQNDCLQELAQMGICNKSDVSFIQVEHLREHGFPMPSLDNVAGLGEMQKKLTNQLPKNVLFTGIQSREGLFFQTDVMIDTYEKVSAWI